MHKGLNKRAQSALRKLVGTIVTVAVTAVTMPTVPASGETTGPAIVHVPVTTAAYGQSIPVSLTMSCSSGASCAARLFYRTTMPADLATLPGFTNEPGFSVVGMNRGVTTVTGAGQDTIDWSAIIPGWAATTRGVDYFFEVEQNGAITKYPGTSYANINGTIVQPSGTYFHVEVLAPPLLNHVPVALGYSDQPINIEAQVSCSSGNCQAELYYHRTGDPNPWTGTLMNQQGAGTAIGSTAVLLTFTGQVPGWSVDTRGVDYYLRATDGQTQAFSPGTPYQGYYAPREGYRPAYYHVHVVEAPRPVHAPVFTAPYRQPIAISAVSDCPSSRACSGTLYYRTTTTDVLDPTTPSTFASTPMSATRVAGANNVDVVNVVGTIPASVADTRGVDYFFSVTDGISTAWFPGTSAADGPGTWIDGIHEAYQHIRVQEPPHFIHNPPPTAEALKDLVIETQLTCATEQCSANLSYSTTPSTIGTDQTIPMARVGVVTTTSATRVETWRATIPAAQVTTRHVSYYMTATDGYTNTAAPGTFYWGAYEPVDGGTVVPDTVRFHVHVVDSPHPIHVPVGAAFTGDPINIEARSNCATHTCVATLFWRVTSQTWQSMPMPVTAQTTLAYGNDFITFAATIAGGNVTTTGVEYRLEVNDGYVMETTPTYPVQVTDRPPVTTTTTTSIPVPSTTTTTVAPPVNNPPSAPALIAPANAKVFAPNEAQVFTIRATDPDGDPYTGTVTITNNVTGASTSVTTAATASGQDSNGTPTPPLTPGAYTWTARAKDVKGLQGPASTSRTFTVAAPVGNLPPNAPTMVEPASGKAFGPTEAQVFTINATDPNGDAYSGTVTITKTGTGTVTTVPTSAAPSGQNSTGTPTPPLAPGSYTWTARATDVNLAQGPASVSRTFTVTAPANQAPNAPTLVDPPNGKAFGPTDAQLFTINATDPNGDSYTGTITIVNAVSSAVTTLSTTPAPPGQNAAAAAVPPLAAGTYNWSARATDVNGAQGPASTSRSFTVATASGNQPPGTPTIIAPDNGKVYAADEPQAFVISATDSGMLYSGVVTVRNASTAGVVATVSTTQAFSGFPSAGAPNPQLGLGSYTFTAHAVDPEGLVSPESPSRAFTVTSNRSPSTPTLVAPFANKAFRTQEPQAFSINSIDPDDDAYTGVVEVRNTGTGAVSTFTTAPAASGYDSTGAPAPPLAMGSYTWRARAVDARGAQSAWTQTRAFTVANQAPLTPTLVSPSPGKSIPSDQQQVFTIATSDPEGDAYTGTVYIRQPNGTFVTSFVTAPARSGEQSSGTPVPPLPVGNYTWSASATDPTSGTSGESTRRNFSVAPNRPPGVPVQTSPAAGKIFYLADPQSFTFTAEDPDADAYTGTITIRYDWGGVHSTITTSPAPSGGQSVGVPAGTIGAGDYTWEAQATDEFGATGAVSVRRPFTVSSSLGLPPAAIPTGQATTRSSESTIKEQANLYGAEHPAISADGRYVAFDSESTNLVPLDTNARRDVFVHDRVTGVTERVSVSSSGAEATSDEWFESFGPSLSNDGRYVAFISSAKNLVSGDTNDWQDAFVHDRVTGTTTRVSVGTGGFQADGGTYQVDISGNGNVVAFSSGAENLNSLGDNGAVDIFWHNLTSNATEQVSVTFYYHGQSSGGWSENPTISNDGEFIAFQSEADNLVPSDGNFAADIFRYDLYWHDSVRISTDTTYNDSDGNSRLPKISDDGNLVAFESHASDLVSGDTNNAWDVFVYDYDYSTTYRSSVHSSGTQANKDSFDPSISPDGRFVGFRTEATNLVAGDRNGRQDIFLHDRTSGDTTLLSHDADGQQANNDSITPALSEDAMHVAFASWASNLIAADTNFSIDVFAYDRRLALTCVGDALSTVGCLSGYGFKAASDRIGLEEFYAYHAFDVGSDTAYLNVSNGNLVVQGTDMNVPAQGLNMRLTHTYNSQKDQGDGPLGRGWRIGVANGESADVLGALVSAVLAADVGQVLEVVVTEDQFDFFDADGTRHHFIKGGLDGPGWHAPPGVNLTLTDYLVGLERRYKATRSDGVSYEFRPTGLTGSGYFLDRVTDRNGNQLTFGYSGGRLASITDTNGRVMSFGWTGDYLSSASYGGLTVNYSVNTTTGRLDSVSVGGRTVNYGYDYNGPLNSVTDGNGHTTSFTLQGGMLAGVRDRGGKDWGIAYNGGSCQPTDSESVISTCITDPEGNAEVYTSSAAGNLLTHRDAGDPTPHQRSYLWENNRVVSETDEGGNTSEYAYNPNGQIILKRESGSGDPTLTTAMVYRDISPGVADLIEAHVGVDSGDERVWRFGRSETGDVTSTTDPDGAVTTMGYISGGRLSFVRDARGNTVSYGTYDASGQPQTITDQLSHAKSFTYDAFGRLKTMTDRNGALWSIDYDARGNVITRSTPTGSATYTYDNNDNLKTASPPGGATLYRDYDPRDLVQESRATVDGVVRKTQYAYFPDGQLQTIKEPRTFAGPTATQQVTYMRAANNWTTAMIDESGFQTDVTYTPDGRVRTTIDPLGATGRNVTSFAYNRRGQPASVTESGHSNPSTNVYGLHGELLSSKTPKGQTSTFAYDKMGRLLRTVDAQGKQSTRTYDAVGNLMTLTQPEGQGNSLTTTYSYTARNEIQSESDPADGAHVSEYVYDNEGRQRFRYERYNGTVERTVEQTYRSDGKLETSTATGTGVVTHASSYTYDAVGNLKTASASLGGASVSSLTFDYNEAFEPQAWSETVYDTSGIGRTKSGSYTYQADGMVASRVVDGQTTSYGHTVNGREASVTPWFGGSFTNEYFDNGLLRKTTMPNGVVTDQLFDPADRLTSRIVHKPDLAMTQLSAWTAIAYDDDDLRTSEAVVQRKLPSETPDVSEGNGTFNYDSLGRLTSAKHPFEPDTTSYTLDDGGNILKDADTVFTYAKNRLLRRTGSEVQEDDESDSTINTTETATYDYDHLGNQAKESISRTSTAVAPDETHVSSSSRVNTYLYDAASHPTRVAVDDGSFVAYVYDALGRMARRVEHPTSGTDVVTLFFHDGATEQLAVETDGAGNVQTRYVLDSTGEPVAQEKNGSRSYYVDDPRGNLTQQLDGSQNVVAVYNYDPYGKEKKSLTKSASANWESRLRFQMGPQDPATGAYNLGGRLFNPEINRFVGADNYVAAASNMELASDPLTGNRYLYAGANPAGMIDDGHGWGFLKKAAKFGKSLLKNSFVRSVIIGVAIGAVCGATAGFGCAIAVGAVAGGLLGGANYMANAKNKSLGGFVKAVGGGAVSGAIEGATAAAAAKAAEAAKAAMSARRAAAAERAGSLICAVNSFVPATLVLMADGTTKRIDDVQLGDMVMAEDPETGERGPREVTGTIVGEGDKDLVDVEVDGRMATATAHHPFWVEDQGLWLNAEDLRPGDALLRADGGTSVVDDVRERHERRRVHNLTVAGIHTYFVVIGSDPVLVHNCGGVHGNSRLSTKPAFLYRLEDAAGNYLKTGITNNPAGRYTKKFMQDKVMNILTSGARSDMLNLERFIVEIDPGPLNLERWAGAALK